jgi:hypothetical protein
MPKTKWVRFWLLAAILIWISQFFTGFNPKSAQAIVFSIFMASLILIGRGDRERAKELEKRNFIISHKLKDGATGSLFMMDAQSSRFIVAKGSDLREFAYSDLLAIDCIKNGSSIQKSNRGVSVTGALLGGIIAGPIGGVVGALGAGSTTSITNETLNSLVLNLSINDANSPIYKMTFLNDAAGVDLNSPKAKKAVAEIEEWHARLRTIMASG